MKKLTLVMVGAIGVMAHAAAADTLWDNGPPDGSDGYTNGTRNVFGGRRAVLDDFTLDRASVLQDIHWQHIWNTFPAGSGTGLDLLFRSDAGGAPGNVIANATITSYSEMSTGVTYFNRPGAESWGTFDDIILGAGTYWFEAAIVGPEPNFWLGRTDVTGSQSWVNYEKFGGLSKTFEPYDLNFVLTGIPGPGAVALLGLASLATRRRRE